MSVALWKDKSPNMLSNSQSTALLRTSQALQSRHIPLKICPGETYSTQHDLINHGLIWAPG